MHPSKRDLLSRLTRAELTDVAEHYQLLDGDQLVKIELIEMLDERSEVELWQVLPELSRDRLKELCRAFGLDDGGREKIPLVERLLVEETANDSEAPSSGRRSSEASAAGSDDDPGDDEPHSDAEVDEAADDYECEAGATIAEEEPEDRPYQVEALQQLNAAFSTHRRVVLSLPTGAGKTFVAAKWLADNLRGRALWLTHRIELVQQAEAELKRVFGHNRPVTRWTSAEKVETGTVVVATVTCHSLPDVEFDVLVVDEAHHRAAPSYKEWAKHYRFRKELGLTATPERHDQAPLGYEAIVKRSFWDLVQQRYLAAPIHHVVQTNGRYDLRKDRIRDDFEEASLRALDNPTRNRVIVEEFLRHRTDYKKTLIFAINVDHADRLVSMFQKLAPEVRTASILGTTNSAQRAKLVDDFERGRLDVLINCRVFVEGFNCKDIQTIFLTRPTMSAVLYCQMVGRGTRIVGDKRTFHLVEFADQLSMFADKLAGFWSLGEAAPEVIRRAKEAAESRPADPPLLLSREQIVEWSTALHSIAGVLAYWTDPPGVLQGASLIYKNEVDTIAAAFGADVPIDPGRRAAALEGGHWPIHERQKLVNYVHSGFHFHLYDFRRPAPPPEGTPAAVVAIRTAAEEMAPFVRVDEFLGDVDKIDWGASAAEWRSEFLAQRQSLAGVLRVVDDITGRITPQKVSNVEADQIRAALAEIETSTVGASGERLYALQQAIYQSHLKGTGLTEYKWFCLAKSTFRREATFLDLQGTDPQ